jgi:hypothetical protein
MMAMVLATLLVTVGFLVGGGLIAFIIVWAVIKAGDRK